MRLGVFFCSLVLAAGVARGVAPALPDSPAWTQPYPPFRIADNLYFVGSRGLANFLVVTPAGHILINTGMVANVPMTRASVEQLGFKFTDIRILLISHAHWDHAAGLALAKELTGAKLMVMDRDVDVIESGGRSDWFYGHLPPTWFPPVKVDRVLHDQDEVRLGGALLVAHLTPGHTKGCTTWTLQVADRGKTLNAVIVGSPNVNEGFPLVNNSGYPEIAADYERTFRVLRALPCDLFLGAHGDYFGMLEKIGRLKPAEPNPFVDPDGYRQYIDNREQAFHTELARQAQNAAAKSPPKSAAP